MRRVSIAGPVAAEPLGSLDPREAAWRPDVADIALASHVATPHYVVPARRVVTAARAILRATPDLAAPATSELLYGEEFALIDSTDGFCWGYALADHYVGYVERAALSETPPAGERRRLQRYDTPAFSAPSLKAPVTAILPVGSFVVSGAEQDGFTATGIGWVYSRSLTLPPAGDWVEIAQSFLGSPYRWGGRTRAGIDCSGLVQLARQLAGFSCRRDSDMQMADTRPVEGTPLRGDLAGWPGHIGILLGAHTLLHANAYHMACVVEPLAEAVARIGAPPRLGRPATP